MSNKKVAILIFGTSVAQLITIGFTPLLSRIYNPDDFGLFAIIFGISSIISTVIGGRYEIALVQPENDRESLNLSFISAMSMIFFTSIFTLFIIFFENQLNQILNINKDIIILIPLMSFFIGLFNILNMLNTRFELYKSIAFAKISRSVIQNLLPVILSFSFISSKNLIIGYISGFIVTYIVLLKNRFYQILFSKYLSLKHLFYLMKKYKDFPLYSAPASLVDSISQQLPLIFIFYIGGELMNGLYFLAARLISIPTSLIGVSFGQVFYKDVTTYINSNKPIMPLLTNAIKKLSLIAVPIFILIYFLSPTIFPIIFGEEWKESGNIAQYLGSIFLIQFIVSTLSQILLIKNFIKRGSFWKYLYFSTSIILYSFAYFYQMEFYTFLTFLVLHEYLLYLIYFYLIFISVKENDQRLIIK